MSVIDLLIGKLKLLRNSDIKIVDSVSLFDEGFDMELDDVLKLNSDSVELKKYHKINYDLIKLCNEIDSLLNHRNSRLLNEISQFDLKIIADADDDLISVDHSSRRYEISVSFQRDEALEDKYIVIGYSHESVNGEEQDEDYFCSDLIVSLPEAVEICRRIDNDDAYWFTKKYSKFISPMP